MLESSGVKTRGARAVVLGRSRIVGMPMALMLAQPGCDASVTIVHSKTEGISSICNQADILIAGWWQPFVAQRTRKNGVRTHGKLEGTQQHLVG